MKITVRQTPMSIGKLTIRALLDGVVDKRTHCRKPEVTTQVVQDKFVLEVAQLQVSEADDEDAQMFRNNNAKHPVDIEVHLQAISTRKGAGLGGIAFSSLQGGGRVDHA